MQLQAAYRRLIDVWEARALAILDAWEGERFDAKGEKLTPLQRELLEAFAQAKPGERPSASSLTGTGKTSRPQWLSVERSLIEKGLLVTSGPFDVDVRLTPKGLELAGANLPNPPTGWLQSKLAALASEFQEGATSHATEAAIKTAGAAVERRGEQHARSLPKVSIRHGVGAKVDAFRRTNLAKIKSLAADQVEVFRGILEEAEREGWRVEKIRKEVQGRFDVSRSKADLLARDQVLKLNANVTQARQTEAGIVEYVWSSSSDERVREMHDELDGTIQRWDDPPVTNEEGDTNHPGGDYQCRCVAIPILPPLPQGQGETE